MKDSITIKKSDLWKYATIVLVIAVIVLAFFLGRGIGNGGASDNGAAAATGGAVNMNVFLSNSDLFPSIGPENADHVVVEFSDFQCPYCAMASGLPSWTTGYATQYADLVGLAKNVQDLAEQGKVRFIYVPMSFLGQESVYSAQAALCANKQDKFWEMHDAIFTASDGPSENDGKYTKEKLKIIAKTVSGIDSAKFDSCLDNDDTLSDVQAAASQASQAASGTPTFYVDGNKVSPSWTTVSGLIA